MNHRRMILPTIVASTVLLLTGCGQKGALVRPQPPAHQHVPPAAPSEPTRP